MSGSYEYKNGNKNIIVTVNHNGGTLLILEPNCITTSPLTRVKDKNEINREKEIEISHEVVDAINTNFSDIRNEISALKQSLAGIKTVQAKPIDI